MSADVRIIKRYANRKLYDTQHSKYVTLEQIAEMIRHGDDVKIIDNKSKEDLTSITLAQIIFEEEKRQKSFLPLKAMRNIIQNSGDSISQLVTQAQKKVTNILPRKGKDEDGNEIELSEDEPAAMPAAASEQDADVDVDADGKPRGFRELREWVANSQRTMDEWQQKVDDRLRHVRDRVEGMTPVQAIQKDLATLGTRIAELEAKLRPASDGTAPGDDSDQA
jgi:polyhydroxyalkanoate synthesis repressor PhaR